MSKRRSVAEAKATLSECIRQVEQGEPLVITRHGRPVVALVRAEDFGRLEQLRQAGPEGGLASLAGGWEGTEGLVDLLESSPRSKPRRLTSLDD